MVIIVLVVFSSFVLADSLPCEGHVFRGVCQEYSNDVLGNCSVGTAIRAYINYASDTTEDTSPNGYTTVTTGVYGNQLEDGVADLMVAGNLDDEGLLINFTVDGYTANDTFSFSCGGGPTVLHLNGNTTVATDDSGDGGGGGGGTTECTSSWICSGWNECASPGRRTRQCTDANSCTIPTNIPDTTLFCVYIPPFEKTPKEEAEKQVEEIEEEIIEEVKEAEVSVEETIPEVEISVEDVEVGLVGKAFNVLAANKANVYFLVFIALIMVALLIFHTIHKEKEEIKGK